MKVLFLCTGNSCRSQMAEGLLRWLGGSVVEVASAGTDPQPVHPHAIRAMREIGLDISRQKSKSMEPFLGRPFDYVITLCDSARETCPVFPGTGKMLHWSLPDPATASGSEEERMPVFRSVREELAAQIDELLAEILEGFLGKLAELSDATQADVSPPEIV
ncbi:MAG: arsenate reductase ArsC [Acidobacteria bacterium]|nr:arsenate reductase ArsC [Acidobacteriota bacterium]